MEMARNLKLFSTALALVLAALLVMGSSGSARAFPRLGLELGSQVQRVKQGSWDLVGDENDLWGSFSPALGVELTTRLSLWLGYQYGGEGAGILGAREDTAELRLHCATLSLVYAVELLPWLRPYARMGGGAVFGALDLELPEGEERRGASVVPTFFMTGGVLIWPGFVQGLSFTESGPLSEIGFGLRAELGYGAVADMEFNDMDESASPRADEEAIHRPAIELGAMNLSGWTWRFALVSMF